MYPRLITIPSFELFGRVLGPFEVATYGVLVALALLVGLWTTHRLARKTGRDPSRIIDLAVYTVIAGIIGAKLMLLAVEWSYYSRNPRELLSLFRSGGVFYGGFLAAIPAAWWYVRRHAMPVWSTFDVLAPAVALAHVIGRLGCFAAGCCHGRPTDVPWAVVFRDPHAARIVGTPLDVPLHPTQLYEAGATLLLFAFLIWLVPRRRFPGQVTLAYVGLYAVVRFGIEFFRGDSARGVVFGGVLSTSQFIAVLMLLAVLVAYPYLNRRGRALPAAA